MHVEHDLDSPDYHRTGQVGQAVRVARLALAALEVIVVPVDPFEMARGFVFGGDRVVEIDVDVLGDTRGVGLLDGLAHHEGAEGMTQGGGGPGTDT